MITFSSLHVLLLCLLTISWGLPATYWTNPQFKIHLAEVDDHQEEGISDPRCTVLLGLMQKNRRRQKRIGQGLLSIGYAVYKVLPRWAQPTLHS